MEPKQAIYAVRCALQKITFAMRYIFTAICALAAEIHCDVGHDASIIAIAMPRCGELRFGHPEWRLIFCVFPLFAQEGQTLFFGYRVLPK